MRQRLREAEGDLGKKVGDLRAGLVPLLGQMPEAAEAEAKVVAALQDSQAALQQQTKKCQDMQNRIGIASAKKAASEAELQRLQQEDGRIAAELGVPSASSGASHNSAASEFKARLQDIKSQIELARKDVSMTESAKHMYEKFREKSRSKNSCQFCKRAFCGEGDLATFEDAMEKLIAKIPGFLESSHQKLAEVQSQEAALETQRPRWDRIEQLRKDEVPRRQKELQPAVEEERAMLTLAVFDLLQLHCQLLTPCVFKFRCIFPVCQGSLRMLLEPEERERRRLEERAAWTVKRIRGAGILTMYFG